MKTTRFKQLYTIFTLLTGFVFFAQAPVKTSIDSVKIKIGAQANLTLKATVKSKDIVNFPEGKTFGQLEVLESYPVDTVKKGDIYELIKKYGLTQFDSGRYVVPRLPVVINNKVVQSDSIAVEVANIKVDTLKQKMFDIKPVSTASADNTLLFWLLGGIPLLAFIIYGLWWYFKGRNRKPATKKKAEEKIVTPIERATAQLQDLESKDLLQQGAVKEYYSELADIARSYIEEAIHIPAMESTTGELIEAMRSATQRRKMLLKPETFEQLEQVLRTADLVKFAKSRPLDFEIAEDRTRIEKTIVVIDKSIPEEKPEDEDHTKAWLEQKRRMEEQKRKRRKRNTIIISAAVLLLVIGGYSIYAGVRQTLYGDSTKAMLEGNWVKSEYGVPGVTIETPHVLKRTDPAAFMPKEAYALYKDMAYFTDGKLFGDFFIAVSTLNMKDPKDVQLTTAVDGVIKNWEAQGAQNILVKTEDFNTEAGIKGARAYGTMSYPNPITKQRTDLYYEIYMFGQQQGMQQITILHKQGDQYAPQIVDRIKNSIQMRNLNQQQQ